MTDHGRVWRARLPQSSQQDKDSPLGQFQCGLDPMTSPVCPALKAGCTLPSRWPSLPFPPKHLSHRERHGKAHFVGTGETLSWPLPLGGSTQGQALSLPRPRPTALACQGLAALRNTGLLGLRGWAPACLQSSPGDSSPNSLS